jgi:hypothetical protein
MTTFSPGASLPPPAAVAAAEPAADDEAAAGADELSAGAAVFDVQPTTSTADSAVTAAIFTILWRAVQRADMTSPLIGVRVVQLQQGRTTRP